MSAAVPTLAEVLVSTEAPTVVVHVGSNAELILGITATVEQFKQECRDEGLRVVERSDGWTVSFTRDDPAPP